MSDERISKCITYYYFLAKVTNVHGGELLGELLQETALKKPKQFLNVPNVLKLTLKTTVRIQGGML